MTNHVPPVEPFYIRQSADGKTEADRLAFFKACAADAKSEGAQLCRFSVHSIDCRLMLVECWKEPARDVPEQGELRWQISGLASPQREGDRPVSPPDGDQRETKRGQQ
jgi:hypothetical protein